MKDMNLNSPEDGIKSMECCFWSENLWKMRISVGTGPVLEDVRLASY